MEVSLYRGISKKDINCIHYNMLNHLHLLSGQILEKPELYSAALTEAANWVISGADAQVLVS